MFLSYLLQNSADSDATWYATLNHLIKWINDDYSILGYIKKCHLSDSGTV